MSENIARHFPHVRLTHEPDFILGASKVRPSTLEVARQDKREALEPRVMQVLVALHRVQPEVVSRDDLIAQCWSGRTVGEDALNRVIGRLRRLSESDRGKSFTIETIARVGYRLLPAAASSPGKPDPAGPGDAPAKSWRALLALRNQSPDSLTEAMELYEQIVAASPQSADGWGGLALAYARISNNMAAASEAMRLRSLAAIQRAEALDPHNALTREAKAWLMPLQGAWLEAHRSFHEGLKSQAGGSGMLPGLDYYLSGMGWVLETADRIAGAAPQRTQENGDVKPPR